MKSLQMIKLELRVKRLERELRKPFRHSLFCMAIRNGLPARMKDCTCGIKEALKGV